MGVKIHADHYVATKANTPTDEVCTCRHLKSQHGPQDLGQHGALAGHGACLTEECQCVQFTWHDFIWELKP